MDPRPMFVVVVVVVLTCTRSSSDASTTATPSREGSVKSVWVVAGGRANLPCRPDPKLPDDQPVLVLWYHGGSDTLPIYSYDAREGEFSWGKHWAEESVVGSRAYFASTSEPPALVLEPALPRDQGIYTCRIDYRISPSTTVTVNLTVVIPPGPPVILWNGRSVVGALGPLEEGQRTELTCRSSGGRPSPMLTWWERGRRLSPLSANATMDSITGTYTTEATLSITATRELLGVTLTCHAHTPTSSHTRETAIVQPRTASVSLNITLPPVQVRILDSGTAATAGTTLRLVCLAAGSHPPAQLTWWRAHTRLPQVTHSIEDGGNITTATLTIVASRHHDGASLSCTGANPALSHHAPLADTTKLIVHYAPVVGLSLGRTMNRNMIKEGDDVYFECNIEANPRFHSVDWHHNEEELVHNMSAGVVMNGLNLVLRNLQRRHSGSYTCTAANVEGRTTSNAVFLTVRHSPMCAGGRRERTQGAARGSTAAVKCTVEAEPAHDITWTWIRKRADGTEEEVPEEDVRSDGLTSSVLVMPHSPDDYGRFMCLAKNAIGRQFTPCVVTLVPAGPPDTPTNCSATLGKPSSHAHTTSMVITCVEGFDGGLPQQFQLETWQDGDPIANMTSEFPEWVVTALRAGVGVTLKVSAYNARGRSDPLVMQVHTTSPQQRAAPDSGGEVDIPPILGAALGLVGVLLLLLIVGVVIARRVRPRPQKPTAAEVPLTPTTGEGFDPDVVASIQRRPPSLDVIPQEDDEQVDELSYEYEQSQDHECLRDEHDDDSRSHSPRESCAYVHRPSDASSQGHVEEQVCVQGGTGRCSCRHRQYSRDAQHGPHGVCEGGSGRQVADSQSDDSGVSESESESELQDLMAGVEVAAVIRQHPDGEAYVTLSPGEPSAHRDRRGKPSSSVEMRSKNSSPLEIRLKPFVSREYRASPIPGEELQLRLLPTSSGEMRSARGSPSDMRAPSSTGEVKSPTGSCGSRPPSRCEREVICLPISPRDSPRSQPVSARRSRDSPMDSSTRSHPAKAGKKLHPSSTKDVRFVPASDQMTIHDESKANTQELTGKGKPVTLMEGDHGDILLVTRRPSETESVKGGRICAPMFPNVKVSDASQRYAAAPPIHSVTLPKAAAKDSKAKALRKVKGKDSVSLEHSQTPNLPPTTCSVLTKGGGQAIISPAGRRSYHPPPHPDVCRRESSV
ncbi:uncharacterized protein [Panulirus ornatus]|uniref:uncharacterized protein n=1 Tax=Panulirus ornatus TaxID=150431 RepID=UPI003A835ECC